jgi:hypothetical protein
MSQSSEFCRHNPLCCFSTSVYYYYKRIFRYWLSLETFGYTLVHPDQVWALSAVRATVATAGVVTHSTAMAHTLRQILRTSVTLMEEMTLRCFHATYRCDRLDQPAFCSSSSPSWNLSSTQWLVLYLSLLRTGFEFKGHWIHSDEIWFWRSKMEVVCRTSDVHCSSCLSPHQAVKCT